MKKQHFSRYSLLSLGMLLTAMSAGGQERTAPSGDAENGALEYYQHSCYGCHGFSGYGQKDLDMDNSPYLTNEQVFVAFLRGRQDVAPLFPSTEMPNYPENALSDEEALDIYAYILSMPREEVEASDIPTLQAILERAKKPYSP